jgi:tetratricopeptide (TPR) repeat protein
LPIKSKEEAPPPYRQWDRQGLACALVLAGAGIAAYSRTLSVPLLFDDVFSIADNPSLRHLATAFSPPLDATVSGRPILNASLALNYAISGKDVWSYHALNLALHILAGMTLFGIVRRTLLVRLAASPTDVAFAAALIWMLHPLQTESVTYLIQRAESLMGLFYLLTLYCFIRSADPSKAVQRAAWSVLAVIACLLGMGTKEAMVSAPLVVLLYDRTFIAGNFRDALLGRKGTYAGLAATWLVLTYLVLSTHGRSGTAGFASGVPWPSYAWTQLEAIPHYLRLCFWPHPLIFDYGSALAPVSIQILPCAMLVAALVGITIWAVVRRPALGFLGACFFAMLAPSSSFIPVATETIAEHRMYLALAPVAVLSVVWIHGLLGRSALPFCLAVAAGLFGITWERNETYRTDVGIWTDTVRWRPGNERAHDNLGFILSKIPGRLDDARIQYEDALALKPDFFQAQYNLACVLMAIPGRTDEAIAQLEKVIRARPDFIEAHYNLGCALMTIPGRLNDAVAQYEDALRLRPDYMEARFNMASVLAAIPGRREEAISEFEEVLRRRPDSVEAHFNLGCAFVGAPGRLKDAVAQFEEALRLRPDYAEAHCNLGNALSAEGLTSQATAEYVQAVRINPGNATFHLNLAISLLKAPDQKDEAVAHLKEALRLQPGNDAARQILARVTAFGR